MHEVQFLLNDEQMKQLGNSVYTLLLNNVNQVRQDTAIDKRYLSKKKLANISILRTTLWINGLNKDYQKSRFKVLCVLIGKL